MEIIVAYDVSTEDSAGRRRLRRVAKVCEGCGQRVQFSVFECRVNETELRRLTHRLVDEMDHELDSLRIYRLAEPRSRAVTVFGRDRYFDPDGPLIL
ncbi:MAG: CRISPR-associated endonuclease Cas2 [Coriobacteriia bacterium]|nr:CRISPR-associated endonuclease Cas2 [Coriobacteriia bacterium]